MHILKLWKMLTTNGITNGPVNKKSQHMLLNNHVCIRLHNNTNAITIRIYYAIKHHY